MEKDKSTERPKPKLSLSAMENRNKNHNKTYRKLILGNKRDQFLNDLAKEIKQGNTERTDILDILRDEGDARWLQFYSSEESEGETLLHMAAKYHNDDTFVRKLSNVCPQLLLMARETSDSFRGQTALHMAITKGNYEAVTAMLEVGKSRDIAMHNLLHMRATGSRFINTVMMGQLPLTVAALKGDLEMVDILLDHGAEIHSQNSNGDTVFHSLIVYSAIYPEKVNIMTHVLKHLNQKIEGMGASDNSIHEPDTHMYHYQQSHVWFLKNSNAMNPLQLAAKLGVSELFEIILNIRDVYCFYSEHDGLFDVKLFDVTEIDTVSNFRTSAEKHVRIPNQHRVIPDHVQGINKKVMSSQSTKCMPCLNGTCNGPETESILEMLFQFSYSSKDAYRIIELLPVKYIIKTKWDNYFPWFIIWAILHFGFMIVLTAFSVENSKATWPQNISNPVPIVSSASDMFVSVFKWIAVAVGCIYAVISFLLLSAKLRRNDKQKYIYHNLEYILPLFTLAICVLVDVLRTVIEGKHDNITLIIALICGWWFNVFFLSPIKHFSFFTEMIKRVIIGDLFRFGLIISFELFAFTAGMFIVFRGANEIQNDFASYGSTLLVMFKLGVGIEDIGVLYDARVPWAAIAIFVLFTIFTYLLLLNALIAMMSQTCSMVLEEKYPQWRVQQLSTILVLEDILCLCCFGNILSTSGEKKIVKGFDPITKQSKSQSRYFLEIHSLQMEYAGEEDKERVQKKASKVMQTLQPPSNMSDTLLNTQDYDLSETHIPVRRSIRQSVRHFPDFTGPNVDNKSPDIDGSDNTRPSVRRKKSNKAKRKELEKLQEVVDEDSLTLGESAEQFKHVQPKIPDIIQTERSPKPSRATVERRRYHSENLHEKETRNQGVQYSSVPEINPVVNINMAKLRNGLAFPGQHQIDIRTMSDSNM